eukprot:TRINITY_DN3894_c0_g1_i1.p2 TRINITY_DN3894_c0_g1~~TRINITY_DN3894_c0_g1_i1.p2  ORF type:complete len:125 (+),score=23.55 TRINITY_DN3894_c0_g1_i1:57-431(+)
MAEPLLPKAQSRKGGHTRASIFYGADEYLEDLKKRYEHDHEIASMKNLAPDEGDPNAQGAQKSQDKMMTIQNDDKNRSKKTGRLFPTANKPEPMPPAWAFLFTRITSAQTPYMWNVLTPFHVTK